MRANYSDFLFPIRFLVLLLLLLLQFHGGACTFDTTLQAAFGVFFGLFCYCFAFAFICIWDFTFFLLCLHTPWLFYLSLPLLIILAWRALIPRAASIIIHLFTSVHHRCWFLNIKQYKMGKWNNIAFQRTFSSAYSNSTISTFISAEQTVLAIRHICVLFPGGLENRIQLQCDSGCTEHRRKKCPGVRKNAKLSYKIPFMLLPIAMAICNFNFVTKRPKCQNQCVHVCVYSFSSDTEFAYHRKLQQQTAAVVAVVAS